MILGRPAVWELSRIALDAAFGLYRKRKALLAQWGVLAGSPSVLDIGCGIGQYAEITDGEYLGIDVNCTYVAHARRRRGGPRKSFECIDASALASEERRFDVAIMVDFLHHVPDEEGLTVLSAAARLAPRCVVALEPVLDQESRLGRWFIRNDRGEHMRRQSDLLALFERAGLQVTADQPLRLGAIATRAIRSAAPVHHS